MLYDQNLLVRLWKEALHSAIYFLNRIASRVLHGATPYELWHGTERDISHLRTFESTAYVHIPKPFRKKLDSESRPCIFVGYSQI